MYQIDENKGFQILSTTPKNQSNNPLNQSQFTISSNPNNKFITNLHSYIPLHDLTSLNPKFDTNSSNPNNSIMNPNPNPNNHILSSDDQDQASKEQNEEQEIRRLKRMISNRESARRSRLRKRKQLENLQSQVLQLLAANHQLAEKLNLVMDSNYELIQENTRLRDESICLRNELIISMKLSSFYSKFMVVKFNSISFYIGIIIMSFHRETYSIGST
ncbi:transcriptional activator TAF-1-like [Amaranthus tricolor]|uniref:transcriptional activator TAF-1-like n=1 Tax=Amaranthus tricolor TaxID=29722 RepID=UPI002586434B|nr:transcriptional activator TAF-1-like [Amaranthus tricolor]